jgi:electron transfer flavoprotein beta subunit
MDIAVLVKGVPDFSEGSVEFHEDNTLDRGSTETVLNPNDHHALECARELKVKHGATIHVLSMGPPNYKEVLHEAAGWAGDEFYLLSDGKFAGADTWATAHALHAALTKIGNLDLVIAGFKTADGETGHTGPQTSLLLDWPIITHCVEVNVQPDIAKIGAKRSLYGEVEHCQGPLPAFIVMDPDYEPTFTKASERLRLKDILAEQEVTVEDGDFDERVHTWGLDDLPVDEHVVGLRGSPTIVSGVDPIPQPPAERDAEEFGTSDEDIRKVAEILAEKGGL